MKSKIIHFLDGSMAHGCNVGNAISNEKIEKSCRQIVRTLEIDHTLQDRYEMENTCGDQLYKILMQRLDDSLFTIYPN